MLIWDDSCLVAPCRAPVTLISIQLCLVLRPLSFSSCTCSLPSTFYGPDSLSRCCWVAIFICSLVLSNVHCIACLAVLSLLCLSVHLSQLHFLRFCVIWYPSNLKLFQSSRSRTFFCADMSRLSNRRVFEVKSCRFDMLHLLNGKLSFWVD